MVCEREQNPQFIQLVENLQQAAAEFADISDSRPLPAPPTMRDMVWIVEAVETMFNNSKAGKAAGPENKRWLSVWRTWLRRIEPRDSRKRKHVGLNSHDRKALADDAQTFMTFISNLAHGDASYARFVATAWKSCRQVLAKLRAGKPSAGERAAFQSAFAVLVACRKDLQLPGFMKLNESRLAAFQTKAQRSSNMNSRRGAHAARLAAAGSAPPSMDPTVWATRISGKCALDNAQWLLIEADMKTLHKFVQDSDAVELRGASTAWAVEFKESNGSLSDIDQSDLEHLGNTESEVEDEDMTFEEESKEDSGSEFEAGSSSDSDDADDDGDDDFASEEEEEESEIEADTETEEDDDDDDDGDDVDMTED